MKVSVCYSPQAGAVSVFECEVADNATVLDAVAASGVLQQFPQLEVAQVRVGVFGKARTLDTPLSPGDRVEIYRPLINDPKDSRRRRAAHRMRRTKL